MVVIIIIAIITATIVIATIRDKCDIKLTTPFKFKTGRTDCIPTDPERPYASSQVFTMMRAIMMIVLKWTPNETVPSDLSDGQLPRAKGRG